MKKEFFRDLYDSNDEYIRRRDPESHNARQIALEVAQFKVPNLLGVLPQDRLYRSVIEIGCATGELLAAFPPSHLTSDGVLRRVGFDISPMNVAAGRARFPYIEFFEQDFRESSERADLVVLSDIIEHVPDDAEFVRAASRMGSLVLVNLPLENNLLNRTRRYGVDDPSGHLRRYSLDDGLRLMARAGLTVIRHRRVWSHESRYDIQRRELRGQMLGAAHSGSVAVRSIKSLVHTAARSIPPFGRILYSSNLFLSASSVR